MGRLQRAATDVPAWYAGARTENTIRFCPCEHGDCRPAADGLTHQVEQAAILGEPARCLLELQVGLGVVDPDVVAQSFEEEPGELLATGPPRRPWCRLLRWSCTGRRCSPGRRSCRCRWRRIAPVSCTQDNPTSRLNSRKRSHSTSPPGGSIRFMSGNCRRMGRASRFQFRIIALREPVAQIDPAGVLLPAQVRIKLRLLRG